MLKCVACVQPPYRLQSSLKAGDVMLNESIKRARLRKGISQEEMAVRLGVVRQTVSKWENGRSVPDAEMLILIAELLDVPVNRLLGVEEKSESLQSMADELARLNEELARKSRQEAILRKASKKRGAIIMLSFAALIAALTVKSEPFTILLMSVCMIASLIILYANLALLTAASTDDLKLSPLRLTTVFDLAVLIIAAGIVILVQTGSIELSSMGEKWVAACVASVIMLFGGYISPKLPFNRHTGLRLPWTMRDEDTWNVARRIIGYISIPCVLLTLAVNATVSNAETASAVIFVLWIAIPSVLSLIFFLKKFH